VGLLIVFLRGKDNAARLKITESPSWEPFLFQDFDCRAPHAFTNPVPLSIRFFQIIKHTAEAR
jgi:hypothetical protein